VLQCVAVLSSETCVRHRMNQGVAVCCSVLQCVAVLSSETCVRHIARMNESNYQKHQDVGFTVYGSEFSHFLRT